jgi:hypothetical protein
MSAGQGAPLKGTPPANQRIRRGVADEDGGAHAGILVAQNLTDNDLFVLWPICGAVPRPATRTANTEELCAQALQAEERRD